MKKIQAIVLVGLLVVMLVTTMSASAMSLQATPIPCPSVDGAPCANCGSGGYVTGWWCRGDGEINYFANCVLQYHADCADNVCHCMRAGLADHCREWWPPHGG